jgi:hypothetical protein
MFQTLSNPTQTRAKALQRRSATFVMPHCNVTEILQNLLRRSGNKSNRRSLRATVLLHARLALT